MAINRLTLAIICGILTCHLCFNVAAAAQEGTPERELPARVTDYNLVINVDPSAGAMHTECTMTVRNTGDRPMRVIPLILNPSLRVKEIVDLDRHPLRFSQNVVSFEELEKYRVNHVQVTFSGGIEPGKNSIFTISYEGPIEGYEETGMRYIRDRIAPGFSLIREDANAYPKVGYPSFNVNRAAGLPSFDYRANITVPREYVVANGGELVRSATSDERVTYAYKNIKPTWRMDFAIARYSTLVEGDMRVFYFHEDSIGAMNLVEAMKKGLALLTSWFGPLSGNRQFTVIEIPIGWGSQADVTSIIQSAAAFQDSRHFPELYHELSHLWNVSSRDSFPARFESEGLATLMQYRVQEELESRPGRLDSMAAWMVAELQKASTKDPQFLSVPMINYGKEWITGYSYSKGMIFYYILYRLAGPEEFDRVIGEFSRTFATTGATSDEFVQFAMKTTGRDLTKLCEEWIYGVESSRLLARGASLETILSRYQP